MTFYLSTNGSTITKLSALPYEGAIAHDGDLPDGVTHATFNGSEWNYVGGAFVRPDGWTDPTVPVPNAGNAYDELLATATDATSPYAAVAGALLDPDVVAAGGHVAIAVARNDLTAALQALASSDTAIRRAGLQGAVNNLFAAMAAADSAFTTAHRTWITGWLADNNLDFVELPE